MIIPPLLGSVNYLVSRANVQYPKIPIIMKVTNTNKNVLLKT